MTFERVDPQSFLDYDKFADSLEIDEVGFLIIALKGSTNKRYYPLREALQRRLESSPFNEGLNRLVARRFFTERNGDGGEQ
jgi:hypothetical protein